MPTSLRDDLTVVITTSPVVSHPSLCLLENVLASFSHATELWDCRKVIVADGCRMRSEAALAAGARYPATRRKYGNPSKAMRSGYVSEDFAARYTEFKVRATIDAVVASLCSAY
jgi:hypothetical protein